MARQMLWPSRLVQAIVSRLKTQAEVAVPVMVDDEKKRLRNEKRAERFAQDSDSKPNLRVVSGARETASPVVIRGAGLRLKDLVEMVAQKTGGKKADLKPTVEAVLEAIGVALATGKDLNVPPLGKLRVAKNQPPVMTLKLRLADGPKAAGLALADEDQDS